MTEVSIAHTACLLKKTFTKHWYFITVFIFYTVLMLNFWNKCWKIKNYTDIHIIENITMLNNLYEIWIYENDSLCCQCS